MRRPVGYRSATFAALLALALQFVLAFGHAHVPIGGNANAAVSAGQPVGFSALPNHEPDDGDHAGGFCDICATITLLGHGWAALPPAPPERQGSHAGPPPHRAAPTPPPRRAAGFRSRAPPLA
jgi:hypothetical protein